VVLVSFQFGFLRGCIAYVVGKRIVVCLFACMCVCVCKVCRYKVSCCAVHVRYNKTEEDALRILIGHACLTDCKTS
jgi:hypothetical protein